MLTFTTSICSENRHAIDSLKQIFKSSIDDTNKVNALLELSAEYKRFYADSSLIYAEQALELSKELNFEKGVYYGFTNVGIAFYYKGEYDVAIDYYTQALKFAKEIGNKSYIGTSYNNIGMVHDKQGSFELANEYYFKYLEITKELDDKKGIAKALNNIGIIYSNQGLFDKANEYYFKSLEIKEEMNDREGMAESFNNLGVVHRKAGSFDKAVEYYQKALEIYEELEIKRFTSFVLNNIGIVYSIEGDYDKALEYFTKSLKIREEMDDKVQLAVSYNNLGNLNKDKGSYKEAIEYFSKYLSINTEIGNKYGMAMAYWSIANLNMTLADTVASSKKEKLGYVYKVIEDGQKSIELAREIKTLFIETEVARLLMNAYKKLGRYEEALTYAEAFIITQDSMLNEEKTKALQEMETKYETEKKNVEIQKLQISNIEIDNKRKINRLIAMSMGLVLLLLLIFFRQRIKTNKLLKDKNLQLQNLNATQNKLMGIISHDFKAPLSAFYSITSSLKSKYQDISKEEIDEYFNRMLSSSVGLKMQLENMLNWAINQSTSINVSLKDFNIYIIAAKVIIILQEFAREKNIIIENQIDEDVILNTDEKLMSIIYNNLISNAVKYSNPNNKVIIKSNSDKNSIIFSVKDFGKGMKKEELNSLFQANKELTKNEESGTGLGLIVAKDLVLKLNGEIWAESEIDKGTEIFIKFSKNE